MFGLSYVSLYEAFFRGRLSVVAPLVATESLWGVGLSAVFLRRTEGVGRRLVLGALLVVVGRDPDRGVSLRETTGTKLRTRGQTHSLRLAKCRLQPAGLGNVQLPIRI